MIREKRKFHWLTQALALCLIGGMGLQSLAGANVNRSSDDWEGHVSVGPAGCDYTDLQSAINDGATGDHGGHIGVHEDYVMTGEYVIDDLTDWQDDPWIVGGFASCNIGDLATASSSTTLNANEQSRHLSIQYDADEEDPLRIVALQNFNLLNGFAGNGGSMLIFGAHGRLSVHLEGTELRGNESSPSRGGAIEVRTTTDTIVEDPGFPPPPVPPQAPPLLVLGDDVWIDLNSAASFGGGIHCEGDAHSISGHMMNIGNALITRNHATFAGGGINANNCPFIMPAGGPWLLGLIPDAGIALNTTDDRGGGIAASGGSVVAVTGRAHDLLGRPTGGNPDHSAMIVGNEANRGGGVYASGSQTVISLLDTAIVGNQALSDNGSPGQGGAVHVTGQALVEFAPRNEVQPCSPPGFSGGLSIFPPCNRIADNEADNEGGAAYVHDGGHLIINDAYITGNSAESGEIIYAFNTADPGTIPDPKVEIENTLMSGNGNAATPGQSLILGDWYSDIEVRWSTMAGNFDADSSGAKITMDGAILADTSLTIIGSILWSDNENVAVVERGSSTIDDTEADCMIGHQPSAEIGISPADLQFYSQIDPEFLNPQAGNFRLSPTSPAIDYCNDQPVPVRDLDGRERDVAFGGEPTEAPNAHPDGIHDIGAFTAQEAGIFQDRFEQN